MKEAEYGFNILWQSCLMCDLEWPATFSVFHEKDDHNLCPQN